MNIIDISSKSKISDSNSFIENIPLFKIKPMNYNLPSFEFTNMIFQSMASVENFKHFEICNNKNIISIGKSTQKALLYKGIKSEVPDIPGSIGLKKILNNKIQNQKFLIVKGKNGLNDIENFINEQGSYSENIICYERKSIDGFDNIKNKFDTADAVIFTSVYGAKIFFNNLYDLKNKTIFLSISERIKKEISAMGFESKTIDYFSNDLHLEIKKAI